MSPRSKEKTKEIREKSQQVIKEAALYQFSEYGYHSSTMSQIAKRANISKGLIYNYFSSKEDLLINLMDDAYEDSEAAFRILKEKGTPKEKLRRIMEAYFELVESKPDYWKLLVSLSTQPSTAKIIMNTSLARMRAIITQSIQLFTEMGSADPRTDFLLFNAHIDGAAMQYIFSIGNLPDELMPPWDQMKKKLIETYCSE